MYKYAVLMEGKGCRIRTRPRYWVLFGRPVVKRMGFFTTRFVEAPSPEVAAEEAVKMVLAELPTYLEVGESDPIDVQIAEVKEDPEAFSRYAPGSGFTWYDGEGDGHDVH